MEKVILVVLHLLLLSIICNTVNGQSNVRNAIFQRSNIEILPTGASSLLNRQITNSSTDSSKRSQPHIFLVVSDDQGYNDLGAFNGLTESKPITPRLDQLSEVEGLKLNTFYVTPLCSPTRGALMTSRWPHRWGGQSSVIQPWTPQGIPLEEVFLPQRLKQVGYRTHMVGKWHLGFCSNGYTPTARGFDTYYGKYLAHGDHFDHTAEDHQDDGSYGDGIAMGGAIDFHEEYNEGKVKRHVLDRNGSYSTDLFAQRSVEIVQAHPHNDAPLFLELAFQAIHWPVQAPQFQIDRNSHIKDIGKFPKRRTSAGMMSAIDDAVGRVVDAFKSKDMWKDTLFIFFSDNGASVDAGASNHPYRGSKVSAFEGGVKVPGIVAGGRLPPHLKGTSNNKIFSVVDIMPTLCHLAGCLPTYYDKSLDNLDGLNVWDAMVDPAVPSPRKEVVFQLDPDGPKELGLLLNNGHIKGRNIGAIRVGKWKLIDGFPGRSHWYGPNPDGAWPVPYVIGRDVTDYNGLFKVSDGGHDVIARLREEHGISGAVTDPEQLVLARVKAKEWIPKYLKNLWLFDLEKDPTETTDLSKDHPEIVEQLRQRLNVHRQNSVTPYQGWRGVGNELKTKRGPGQDPITGTRVFDQWLDRLNGGIGTMNINTPRSKM